MKFRAEESGTFLMRESSTLNINGNTTFVDNVEAHLWTIAIFKSRQVNISGVIMRGCSGIFMEDTVGSFFEIRDSIFYVNSKLN